MKPTKKVKFELQALLYHGNKFSLDESDIVQSSCHEVDDGKLTVMLGLPSIGTYLIKLSAQLVSNRQLVGVLTKKFIKIKVE